MAFSTTSGSMAWAKSQPFVVDDEVAVYEQPDDSEEPAFFLSLGDEILITAGVHKKNFRGIQYKLNGRWRDGYVLAKELKGEDTRKRSARQGLPPRKRLGPAPLESSVYVSAVFSYASQFERDIQTTSDSVYKASEFTGTATFFALGIDHALTESWFLRTGFVMRTSYLEGDAQQEGSPTVYKFGLEQSFYGVNLGMKLSPPDWHGHTFMVEFEYGKSSKQKLKVLAGPPLANDEPAKVSYVTLAGTYSYNWRLNRAWTCAPGLRLGSMVSARPIILLAESLLSLHYHW